MSTIKKVSVNGQVYDLAGAGGGKMVEITYAQLKELVDASGLILGNQYRITDFVSIFNSNIKSANHPFDLIVTANSTNTFYPKAQAMLHEGDDYFANNDLSKWEIWYDFNNDTSKYAFANSSTGKGFIYRMIDENNNDVNYDFKNLLVTKDPHTFHPAFDSAEGEAYFYTFSIMESSSSADLRNPQDLSTTLALECKNNTVRVKYSSNPFLNYANGVVLGIVKGIAYGKINYNHIEGDCLAISSNVLGGSISDNRVFGTLDIKTLSNSVDSNIVLRKFSIGPQNWVSETHAITLGSIWDNFISSDLSVYEQETSGLVFSYNSIRATNTNARILHRANIQSCEIFGNFTSNDSGEYPTISEAQEGKLIVGKGETVSIIDPSTFYS